MSRVSALTCAVLRPSRIVCGAQLREARRRPQRFSPHYARMRARAIHATAGSGEPIRQGRVDVVQFDLRFGEADATRTSMLATELIELRPDVVFAAVAPAAIALRRHTLSIPIVFVQVVDPVAAGLSPTWHDRRAISPASPISSGKWLQLLKSPSGIFLSRPIRL